MHGARQDRRHHDQVAASRMAADVAQPLCRRRARYVLGRLESDASVGRGQGPGRGERGEPGLLQRQVLPQAALSARGADCLAPPGFADAEIAPSERGGEPYAAITTSSRKEPTPWR